LSIRVKEEPSPINKLFWLKAKIRQKARKAEILNGNLTTKYRTDTYICDQAKKKGKYKSLFFGSKYF
jgi:hypothetical protein